MKVLILDNYDSFTFNLYQYCGEILNKYSSIDKYEILVKRNDEVDVKDIKKINPDRIIISPGPGSPENSEYFGVCKDTILQLGAKIPILGICLGMQGIVSSFGGKIVRAKIPMHGKTSFLYHNNKNIHKKIPQCIEIMRYHSLIVEQKSLPKCFEVTAFCIENESSNLTFKSFTKKHEIMGIKHIERPIYGIQYHPESFASEGGKEIISNFLIL
tara:strand:+ start:247 stop:888 length:642 start_codon:yes stop_codon:yes gene_type:complete